MSLAQAAGVAPAGGAPAANVTPAPAADAAGASPAPAPGPSGAEGGGQAQPAGASSAYRPEGLPDHLFGGSDKETIDKLYKATAGHRDAMAKYGAVPETPEGYDFKPSDKIAPLVGDLAQDGFFKQVAGRAHSLGIEKGRFGEFINGVMEDLLATGAVQAIDYAAEIKALVPDAARGLDEAGQKAAASKRIADNLAYVEGAKAQMIAAGMTQDAADEIATTLVTRLGDDARGNRAIEWLRSQGRQVQPAMAGGGQAGVSEADLDARIADPRNDPSSAKFDQAFAEQTDRLFQQQFK